MSSLLVRVGADQSSDGGRWNGPVDGNTGDFVYVPIPEGRPLHHGMGKPYTSLEAALRRFGQQLPPQLAGRYMHLDPDFEKLTYGDQGERAKQLRACLGPSDLVVFYASFTDVRSRGTLVYALIGLLTVDRLAYARDFSETERDINAHTRRQLAPGADDIVVIGNRGKSGRLRRCIAVGEWRKGAYRVREDLLEAWGGLSVRDGWLQRSARLPRFLDPERFRSWLDAQNPELIASNNGSEP